MRVCLRACVWMCLLLSCVFAGCSCGDAVAVLLVVVMLDLVVMLLFLAIGRKTKVEQIFIGGG